MFVHVQRVPVTPEMSRVLASVDVPDPWGAGTRTRFELAELKLVSVHNGRDMGGRAFGLRNARNGELKLVPEAMGMLWQSGGVSAEQVPALLHAAERRYGTGDATLVMARTRHIWLAALFALFSIAGLGFALWWRLEARASAPHTVHEETLASLARPLRDHEAVRTNDAVPVLAAVSLDAVPPVDPKLIAMPGRARLVVASIGGRHRWLWTVMPIEQMALVGVVWPTRELDPRVQPAIEKLARQFPDVERTQVFGQMWMWTDGYGSFLPAWLGVFMAAIFGGTGIFIYAFVERRKASRRREVIYLRDLAAKLLTLQGAVVSSTPG